MIFYSERISNNLIAASGILVPGPKIAAAPAAEAKPKTRRSRAKKATDAVEDATVVKAPKAKAPKAAATKATAAKVAKKTNVGKKM